MEQPPFQFGLKTVFVVLTTVAVLLATWITAPKLLMPFVVLLAVVVAFAIPAALSIGVVLCGIAFANLATRLFGLVQHKPPDA